MKFYYPLAQSPVTFDFVIFLVACDILRERLCSPNMEIVIGPGERPVGMQSLRDQVISAASRSWRTYELLPELARLLPSVNAVSFGYQFGGANPSYIQRPMPKRACLRAPEYALPLVPYEQDSFITLSVRQSEFQPERNTDPLVWNEVLKALPLPVVVVPDTEAEVANKPCAIHGHKYVPASMNPALRMALYEKAKLNLFTSSGPTALAWFSNVHAEVFKMHVPGIEACDGKHLNDIGTTDGAQFNNTVVHWSEEIGLIKDRIAARLNERSE